MDELKKLTNQWLEIAKATGSAKEQLDRFYEEKIFPIVFRNFVIKEEKKLEEINFDGLIMTVGTSPEPVIMSLSTIKPKRILFLCTEESEQSLDKVISFTQIKPSSYEKEMIVEPFPISIYKNVQNIYNAWQDRGIKKIAVDITAGKKTMTSGLAMVGALLNFQLIYIGNRDYLKELRRPRPGSEYLEFIDNPYAVFGTLREKNADILLQHYDYRGASEIYRELSEKCREPLKYMIKYKHAEALHQLDLLNISESAGLIKEANLLERQYYGKLREKWDKKTEDLLHLSSLIPKNPGDSSLELLKDKKAVKELIQIIYKNAMKRAALGRLDAASLYLYRLIEILEQRRFALYDIDTAKPDYSKIKLNNNDLLTEINRIRKSAGLQSVSILPSEISLISGYIILQAINDDLSLSKRISLSLKRMQSHLKNRNFSVLAHGFSFVTENNYKGFKRFVDELIQFFAEVENIELSLGESD